jgi:HSP20 family protein
MELVRWRPGRHLPIVQDEMDRAFDRLMRQWASPVSFSEAGWNPSVDVVETDDEIVVRAEIPGVNRDDIDLTVENNRMIISGEKKQEHEEKDDNYYLMERSYGSFRRIFVLPAQADADKVAASYKDGVLTVTVPKTEVAKGKKIDIKDN